LCELGYWFLDAFLGELLLEVEDRGVFASLADVNMRASIARTGAFVIRPLV
jgi:hypothetical protein